MQLSDFSYDLPEELIAQHPLRQRTASRLLCLCGQSGELRHRQFEDLVSELNPGDRLVMNNTRVIAARLRGRKSTGGKVEILVERITGERTALAKIRASKAPKPGSRIILGDQIVVEIITREEDMFLLEVVEGPDLQQILDTQGTMPLPPYIERPAANEDAERYQTVYARHDGAVAAPTAGLHFTDELLSRLQSAGIDTSFVTLHVGAGTFQPVRTQNLDEHVMHAERASIDRNTVEQIIDTKEKGGRVIAVGTTSVRVLESAAHSGELSALDGDTRLFIRPGDRFNVVDGMITNFHLPESTLLMLVSAFCGTDNILKAYNVAVEQRYRFFSYGDAMLLWPADAPVSGRTA